MGGGRWDNEHTRSMYTSYSKAASSTTHVKEFMKSSKINEHLDPKGVMLRESCDSELNPNSNAIIVGLDVTGSMGHIAHSIAKEGLGTLIEGIHDRKPVEDPHIMFMAIGDAIYDQSPLQVSQFEADITIAQQLKDIYVEQGGGGNNFESYDLPWYFAGNRTSIDCFEKRQKKGYLFTIGDEYTPQGLTADQIKNIFGDNDQQDYTRDQLLEMAQEKYHVFHLIVEQGSCARHALEAVTNDWKQLLGHRAIGLSNHSHLSEVIVSVMQVNEGQNPEDIAASWQDTSVQATVKHALGI